MFGDSELQESDSLRRVQVVRVGPLQLGLFEDEIATIAEWRDPTPLPRAPAAVIGVVSIQGRMLTVLNPLRLLAETVHDDGFSPAFIVALRGAEQLALAVEGVEENREVAEAEIESPEETNALVLGILNNGKDSIRVLDVKNLFLAALQGRERRRRRLGS